MIDTSYLAHLSRGGEFLSADRLGEAKSEFERALVLRPGDPRALSLLGMACYRLELYEEAADIFHALVVDSPEDAGLRLNLGLVHLKSGAVDAAVVELEQVVETEPGQLRAHGFLGLAYAKIGEFARAREAFRKSGQLEMAQEMESLLAGAPAIDRPELRPDGAVDVSLSDSESRTGGDATGDDENSDHEGDAESLRRIRESGFDKLTATGGDLAGVDELAARARERGDSRWDGPVHFNETTSALVSEHARRALSEGPSLGGPAPLAAFVHQRLVTPRTQGSLFEVMTGGALVVRVAKRVFARTERVVCSGGELSYVPALRRMKGGVTAEPMGIAGAPMFEIRGNGVLVAMPGNGRFVPIALSDEPLYVREEAVFGFDPGLSWESGRLPSRMGVDPALEAAGGDPALRYLSLRGEGAVCLYARRAPVTVQISPDWSYFVEALSLIGWTGKISPRVPTDTRTESLFVECSGDGGSHCG